MLFLVFSIWGVARIKKYKKDLYFKNSINFKELQQVAWKQSED